jgi:hypothetical protein
MAEMLTNVVYVEIIGCPKESAAGCRLGKHSQQNEV